MFDPLTWLIWVLCLPVVVGLLVLLAKDEIVGDRIYLGLAIVEVALLVQLVIGAVALSGTDRDVEGALFISYLVGNLLALPIGAFWALAERTRAGTAVLLVAVVAVAALQVRIVDIWAAGV